ncbi:hypothetical protein J4210_02625 [Candidatus Woesearchaeota archaeon]|nr:hypothetical protein [Candidatus Woesearchaeota archaeon]
MEQKRKRCAICRSIPQLSSQKRGQVTIFIIIGILLVLALIVVVFVRKEVLTTAPEELITTGKGPVADFIAMCIKQLGEEALLKAGEQGGYVALPAEIAQNGYVHLKTSPFTAVPYWAYGTTRAVPSLPTIKSQIDAHIRQHLRSCLFDRGAFSAANNIIEKSEITVDTNLAENKVIFSVRWDLEVQNKAGEKIIDLLDHAAESPVKFKRLYDAAVQVVDVELRELKLEDITQDLIALEHPDVPVVGFELSCSPKHWNVEKVKQTVQDLLRVNIGQLKVKGTEIIEFPDELPYYQNHYIWDLGDDFAPKNVVIDFHYDNSYPFTFDVRPRSGSTLKSAPLATGSNPLIAAFCAHSWKFTYDVSYPVLVTLRDATTGYTFKTALTVHLQRNIPNREESIPAVPPSFVTETYSDQQFCAARNVPLLITTSEAVDNGEDVSFSEPLAGVDITYNCLHYQCSLGQTEYDYAGMGDVAAYQFTVPYCANAVIRAQKENYADGWSNLVAKPGARADLRLIPTLAFPATNISLVKHYLSGDAQFSAGTPLAKDETTIIKLSSVQKDVRTNLPLVESTVVLSSDLSEDVLRNQPLKLLAKADFTYNVDIAVLNGERFSAGYKANWTASWQELEHAQRLTFHVVGQQSTSDADIFALYAELAERSAALPLPELSEK